MALTLSQSIGFSETQRVKTHLDSAGLPTSLADLNVEATASDLYGHMAQDKKVEAGEITFVLSKAIGTAHTARGIQRDAVLGALRAAGAK